MPDAPVTSPAKTAAVVAEPSKTTARDSSPAKTAVPVRVPTKAVDRDSSSDASTAPFAGLAKVSPWIIALGALCVVLAIAAVVFERKVSARDDLMNAVLFPIETEDANAHMQLFHFWQLSSIYGYFRKA